MDREDPEYMFSSSSSRAEADESDKTPLSKLCEFAYLFQIDLVGRKCVQDSRKPSNR